MKTFWEEKLLIDKNYEIPTGIFFNLSKKQFILLKDVIPSLTNNDQYLKIWFAYNYYEQLEPYMKIDLSISEKDEKRKVLLFILDDLKNLKTNKTK